MSKVPSDTALGAPCASDVQEFRWVNNYLDYQNYVDPRVAGAEQDGSHAVLTASDAEIYSVLSLLNPPEAIALLVMGARTEEDVRRELAARDALDLLVPRPEMVAELIKRDICPLTALQALLWATYDLSTDKLDLSVLAFDQGILADVVELRFLVANSSHATSNLDPSVLAVRGSMMAGEFSLKTLKALVPEVKLFSQINTMFEAARDLNAVPRNYSFTLEDLRLFARRAAKEDGFYELSLAHLTSMFVLHGWETMSKVNSFAELTNFIDISRHENGSLADNYRLALRATMLQQAVTAQRPLTGGEWSTVVESAQALHDSGVSLEDATPYLVDGIPARKIRGILDGLPQIVSEGWL